MTTRKHGPAIKQASVWAAIDNSHHFTFEAAREASVAALLKIILPDPRGDLGLNYDVLAAKVMGSRKPNIGRVELLLEVLTSENVEVGK